MTRAHNSRQEWWTAQGELRLVIAAAGLEQPLKEVNDRNAYIRSGQENLKDERDLVFALPDVEKRKRIIHWTRECERLMRVVDQEELREKYAQVADGGYKTRRNALWGAAIFAAAAVLLVGQYWGVIAAIAAAAVGVIAGVQSIVDADRRAVLEVEQARNEAKSQSELLAEIGSDLSYSGNEERTGLADS